MLGVINTVKQVIHDTSAAIIDKQITQQLSAAVGGAVSAGFVFVEEVLAVVKDLTVTKGRLPSRPGFPPGR